MSLSVFQYNIISYLLLLPAVLNLFVWQHPLVSLAFGGMFLVFQVLVLTQLFDREKPPHLRIVLSLSLFLLIFLLLQTMIYITANLTPAAQAVSLLLLPAIVSLLISSFETFKLPELAMPRAKDLKLPAPQLLLLGLYVILAVTLFIQIFHARTDDAILTPWSLIPPVFWVIYFLATTVLIVLSRVRMNPFIQYLILCAHLLLSVSAAVIIYAVGYGFDPFLHQAAEKMIAARGIIDPKTPYYLGQYSFVVGLHHLLGFDIVRLDRWLLPLLFSVSLPAFFSLVKQSAKTYLGWTAILVLMLPFSVFISTTPQGLANLFFLWGLLLSLPYLLESEPSRVHLLLVWLSALAALLIHPLAGIPAVLFAAFLSFYLFERSSAARRRKYRLTRVLFFLLACVSIPGAFALQAYFFPGSKIHLGFLSNGFAQNLSWLPLQFSISDYQFRSLFYEAGYFIGENIYLLILGAALLVMLWLINNGKHKIVTLYGGFAAVLFINAVLLANFIHFEGVISYERSDYALRLFRLSMYSLLPLLILGLIWLDQRLKDRGIMFHFLTALFFAWVASGVLFISYPRDNAYEIGHQYSVSRADIATVQEIAKNATDYAVLANQSVSAAAVKTEGFKKYYNTQSSGQVFYYPIPTSGSLYDIYLQMVYEEPTRDHARMAADLTGASNIYFVVNPYWENADDLIEKAKRSADDWQKVRKNYLFKYDYQTKTQ